MTLDELTAIELIKQLKARYCRFLDTKDWDGYANLFAHDATLDVDTGVSTSGGDPRPIPQQCGRLAIRSGISGTLRDAITVHHCHTPEITLTSAVTASGIWAMEDIVELPGSRLNGQGHYNETYVIEEGEWRIASLHLTRTRIDWRNAEAAGSAG